MVSVASGHALGKDYIASCLILWFLLTHIPSIVLATAPTQRQVQKVIWGELENKVFGAKFPIGGRLITNQLIMDDAQRWYALGFTTKDIKKTPGKFQGFHQKNVLLIFSEAQAIERPIWEQAESLMTGENVRWIALGNPLVSYGAFYETWRPGSGWFNIRLDCEDNPNYLQRREVIPGLASYDWVERMAAKRGRDHPFFRSKVKGIFPKQSIGIFIQPEWLEFSNNQAMESFQETDDKAAGVDIAGSGDNKTVITKRHGPKAVSIKKFEKQSTTETRKLIEQMVNDGYVVYYDCVGIGIGPRDELEAGGYHNRPGPRAVPINAGWAPYVPEFATDMDKKRADLFADLGTQLYFNFARKLETRKIAIPYDEDLNMQLTTRKMLDLPTGKIKLEPKKSYIEVRGFPSPDEADSMVLAFTDSSCVPSQGTAAPFTQTTEDPELMGIFS